MTLLLAEWVPAEGAILYGQDSGIAANAMVTYSSAQTYKWIHVENVMFQRDQYLLGIAGTLSMISTLNRFSHQIPAYHHEKHNNPYDFVNDALLPFLFELAAVGKWEKSLTPDQALIFPGEFLVAIDGGDGIFAIDGAGGVEEIIGMAAIGSGAPSALAANNAIMTLAGKRKVDPVAKFKAIYAGVNSQIPSIRSPYIVQLLV